MRNTADISPADAGKIAIMPTDPERIHILRDGVPARGPVVYWMSRDQRIDDNHALAYAAETARKKSLPLIVTFCLAPSFLGATARQYDFMLKGLEETTTAATERNIPFVILEGDPDIEMPAFLKRIGAGLLVTDFDPLRIKRLWRESVARMVDIPFHEIDAHNIVPCRAASNKREFSAATFRPKIKKLLSRFLTGVPDVERHSVSFGGTVDTPNWKDIYNRLSYDTRVQPVPMVIPGSRAAHTVLASFIDRRLERYHFRNDPNKKAVSGLSPYLHFGQISAERIVLDLMASPIADSDNAASFLEELIVRRELADNFCLYEPHYDTLEGAHNWAKTTLDLHRGDRREYLYSPDEFERAATHDPLWNAAQIEMAATGTMHGYLRMYWAKKILEWSDSPEAALATAIYLNDRYELDGRDPNGYAGCLWSIGGLHDRTWGERPVFGKIRYMGYEGCRRKFNVDAYIARMDNL